MLEEKKAKDEFYKVMSNKNEHTLSLSKNPTLKEKFFKTVEIQKILKTGNKKLCSIIPLTKSNVPNCVTIDTSLLYSLFTSECYLIGIKWNNYMQKKEEL